VTAALDAANAQSPASAAAAAGLPGGVTSASEELSGQSPVAAALDMADGQAQPAALTNPNQSFGPNAGQDPSMPLTDPMTGAPSTWTGYGGPTLGNAPPGWISGGVGSGPQDAISAQIGNAQANNPSAYGPSPGAPSGQFQGPMTDQDISNALQPGLNGAQPMTGPGDFFDPGFAPAGQQQPGSPQGAVPSGFDIGGLLGISPANAANMGDILGIGVTPDPNAPAPAPTAAPGSFNAQLSTIPGAFYGTGNMENAPPIAGLAGTPGAPSQAALAATAAGAPGVVDASGPPAWTQTNQGPGQGLIQTVAGSPGVSSTIADALANAPASAPALTNNNMGGVPATENPTAVQTQSFTAPSVTAVDPNTAVTQPGNPVSPTPEGNQPAGTPAAPTAAAGPTGTSPITTSPPEGGVTPDVGAALANAGTPDGGADGGADGATGGTPPLSPQSITTPIPPPDGGTPAPPDGGTPTPPPFPMIPFSPDGGNFNPEEGLFVMQGLPGGGTNQQIQGSLPGGVQGPILGPITDPNGAAGNFNSNEGLFAALNNAVDTMPPQGNLNPNQGIG
jgi:hypothetical protein